MAFRFRTLVIFIDAITSQCYRWHVITASSASYSNRTKPLSPHMPSSVSRHQHIRSVFVCHCQINKFRYWIARNAERFRWIFSSSCIFLAASRARFCFSCAWGLCLCAACSRPIESIRVEYAVSASGMREHTCIVHVCVCLCVCAHNGHGHQHRKQPGVNLACLFLLHIHVGLFACYLMALWQQNTPFGILLSHGCSSGGRVPNWKCFFFLRMRSIITSSAHTIEFAIKNESILAMAEPNAYVTTSDWGFARRDLCRQFYNFLFFWISEKLENDWDNSKYSVWGSNLEHNRYH